MNYKTDRILILFYCKNIKRTSDKGNSRNYISI